MAETEGVDIMRTAQEMLDCCIENGFGHNTAKIQTLISGHFGVISKHLMSNESVLLPFHGWISGSTFKTPGILREFAFAITEQRILIGTRALVFGGEFFYEIPLSNLVSVNMRISNAASFVLFDTIIEKFEASVSDTDVANRITRECHKIMDAYATSAAPEPVRNPLDEIRQLKELLDMGAITQEEFDTKKEKLLGLYKQSI